MLIRLVVVVLLIIWASDREKWLGPALVYGTITMGFGLLVQTHTHAAPSSVLANAGIEFALACVMFWLVSKTGGPVGWLVRVATLLVLGGVGVFLLNLFGK